MIPVIMLITGRWDFREVIVLYWAESGIIGFFTILKILLAKNLETSNDKETINASKKHSMLIAKVFLITFFCIHFGIFMFGHAFFIYGFILNGFNKKGNLIDFLNYLYNVKTAVIALFISHGFSFFENFIMRGENKNTSIGDMFIAPYPRIIIMHITIVIGAFAMMIFKLNNSFMIIFVLLKILFDIKAPLEKKKDLKSNELRNIT